MFGKGPTQAYVNLCSLEYVLLHISQTCSLSDERLSSGEEARFPEPEYWLGVSGVLGALEGALLCSRSGGA